MLETKENLIRQKRRYLIPKLKASGYITPMIESKTLPMFPYSLSPGLIYVLLVCFGGLAIVSSNNSNNNRLAKSWTNVDERVWIGSEFWSNRLQYLEQHNPDPGAGIYADINALDELFNKVAV